MKNGEKIYKFAMRIGKRKINNTGMATFLLNEWEYEKENAPRRVINKLSGVSFGKQS